MLKHRLLSCNVTLSPPWPHVKGVIETNGGPTDFTADVAKRERKKKNPFVSGTFPLKRSSLLQAVGDARLLSLFQANRTRKCRDSHCGDLR